MKRLATLAKDRPMTSRDTAIYWIEYVLRHHGAPHMHYAAADLNFIEDNSIDVLAFLLVAIYLIFKILSFIVKLICCCGGKKEQKLKRN